MASKKLSEKTHIPYATVNKIMRLLVKSGICDSKGGKFGGFILNKPLTQVSILDVISGIEGLYDHITDCLDKNSEPCALALNCKINKRMRSIDTEIYTLLKNKNLSTLVSWQLKYNY